MSTITATTVADSLTIYVKATNPNYSNVATDTARLEITKRTVILTSESDDKPYDGTALTKPVVAVTGDGFVEGEVRNITANGSVTNVAEGKITNDITFIPRDGYNEGNYDITRNEGKLEITPRTLTLTSGSFEREYNGKALTNDEVEGKLDSGLISEEGWVKNEGATYTFTKSVLLTGDEVDNEFEINWNEGTAASNYSVVPNYGKLSITERTEKYAIEVVAKSSTDNTYDGEPHDATGFVNEDLVFTVDGNTYTVSGLTTSDPKETNATTADGIPNAISGEAIVKDAEGNIVTDQFDVTLTDGSLIIKKALLTLTSGSRSREYNGNAVTNDDVLNKLPSGLTVESGWVKDEGATYGFTGSALLAGESKTNTFSITPKEGTLMDNYDLIKTEGDLGVTNRTAKYGITVTAKSSTDNTYDGTQKSVSGFEGEYKTFVIDGNSYTLSGLTTSDPTRIAATDSEDGVPNTISGTEKVTDAAGNDVTGQFTVTKNDGKLIVKKRPITITVMGKSKLQGEADPAFGNAIPSEQRTELADIDLKVKRTNNTENVGTYENVLTITPTEAELNRDYPNFEFKIINGTFTIKAPDTYGLKVTYKYSNGEVVDTFDKTYSEGEKATAQRKIPDGYTAEVKKISNADLTNLVTPMVDTKTKTTTVSGNIGTASVEYEVTYTPTLYTLTIDFQVFGEEDVVATITRKYYGGTNYTVLNSDGDIPWDQLPKGYRIIEVKKVMPNGDTKITVYVVAEGDDTVTFLDDPTPLGINNATLGTGEIVE